MSAQVEISPTAGYCTACRRPLSCHWRARPCLGGEAVFHFQLEGPSKEGVEGPSRAQGDVAETAGSVRDAPAAPIPPAAPPKQGDPTWRHKAARSGKVFPEYDGLQTRALKLLRRLEKEKKKMAYRECKSARDMHGRKIAVGDRVQFIKYENKVDGGPHGCPPVTVKGIHAQGADGTILTTDPAPDPDYPHHFSCRASRALVVK